MERTKIAIVGAGASGLAAALAAAGAGAGPLVLEKNRVPGRKVLASGSGKCNLTNAAVSPADYHGPEEFLAEVFRAMPPAKVRDLFSSLGLLMSADADGRFFPRSRKAQDVVSVLLNPIEEGGGRVLTLTEVEAVRRCGDGFELDLCEVPPAWEKGRMPVPRGAVFAEKVILACGSAGYPQLGGTAAGLRLAESLGHRCSPFTRSMVPLNVREGFARGLSGVRLDARLSVHDGDTGLFSGEGELLFTDAGLSGPLALEASREASPRLSRGALTANVDFFPEMEGGELLRLVSSRAAANPARRWDALCAGLADAKVCVLASELAGIRRSAAAADVSAAALRKFCDILRGLRLTIDSSAGLDESMVCRGGADPAEVDPRTFASLKVPGLFITGEMLDIDGRSGGFNLHFAWTSGLLAGAAAAAGS